MLNHFHSRLLRHRMNRRDACRRRDRLRWIMMVMVDVVHGVDVVVHGRRDRPGHQRGRGTDFHHRRRRPGSALFRFLLLLLAFRRSAQILRFRTEILGLGNVVHHDVDDLF